MRVEGVDRVRRKNSDAENTDQYGCKLNHETRPVAQPVLNLWLTSIRAVWFQDDFVGFGKWFRRQIPVPRRPAASQIRYPAV
jgi:hypothetical protein